MNEDEESIGGRIKDMADFHIPTERLPTMAIFLCLVPGDGI